MAKSAEREESRALTPVDTLRPPRLPVTESFLERHELTSPQWRTLIDSAFPNARTADSIIGAVDYCRVRNLDPFKRVVHIVPMWSKQLKRYVETVWPGIAELRTTATRTKSYAGIDKAIFGPTIEREFVDKYEDERDPRNNRDIKRVIEFPEFCDVVVYRLVGGIRCPFYASVLWVEAYATVGRESEMPNEMWRKRPFGQLEKCAEAAGLRRGFPEEIGGELAAEEAAYKTIDHDDPMMVRHIVENVDRPRPPKPPPAKPKPQERQQAEPQQQGERGEMGKDDSALADAKIVDAEVEDLGGDQRDDGSFVMTESDEQFLSNLRDRLTEARDEAELEVIWTELDPLKHFEDDELNQQTALSIREFRLGRLARQK